jgi:hypothetical protein
LLYRDNVVANVSVNVIDFLVLGEQKRYIQIGTVMTDKEYCEQGLSRALMEKVLREWESKCELIYLFANDSVWDLYPKFGFVPTDEFQFSKSVIKKDDITTVRKLEISNIDDRNLLFQTASHTVPFSKITMLNNPYLVIFYCTSFMKNSVYYIDDYDVVVVADFDKEILYLQDVFSTKNILLDKVIDALINEQTKKVVLGFVPEDISSYGSNLLKGKDTTLFVKEIKEEFPKNLMFPILSHA